MNTATESKVTLEVGHFVKKTSVNRLDPAGFDLENNPPMTTTFATEIALLAISLQIRWYMAVCCVAIGAKLGINSMKKYTNYCIA